MLDAIRNFILLRNPRVRRLQARFLKSLEPEFAEEILELLLRLMSLVLLAHRGFRKNIEGFKGRYLFRSRDNEITVAAIFENNRLRVKEAVIDDTDLTVTFRDAKALLTYLFSPKPDILGSLLRQDVVIDGNLNYLYKFAYMANHLRLMAAGKV